MATGYWNVRQDQKSPRDIDYQIVDSSKNEPEEQGALRIRIEATRRVLSRLYGNDNDYKLWYRELLNAAAVGLEGVNAHPEIANSVIDDIRRAVLESEAGTVKNHYLKELGKITGALGLWALLLGLLTREYLSANDFTCFFFVWVGTMAGVWLSFSVRRVELSFEQLVSPEEDRLGPAIRSLVVGLLALLIALLFYLDAVNVTIGAMTISSFKTNAAVAILLGALLGISEKTLGQRAVEYAGKLFK